MANWDLAYSCGHAVRLLVGGPKQYLTRERWAGGLCRDCRQAERDKASASAADDNAGHGLPALTGSPEQVRWAEALRADKLLDLNRTLEQHGARREVRALYQAVLGRQTRAPWWIDQRTHSAVYAAHGQMTREERRQAHLRRPQ